MDQEVGKTINLGVVLIAIAVVLVLGFGIFQIARNTASEGTTSVISSLDTISDSNYVEYDQKIVTGSQVMSAINNFKGKACALLVSTAALEDTQTGGSTSPDLTKVSAASGITATYDNNDLSVPIVVSADGADSITITPPSEADKGDTVTVSKYGTTYNSTKKSVPLIFMNYNALLSGTPYGVKSSTKSGAMYFSDSGWVCPVSYSVTSGRVDFNYSTTNLSKSGMCEYIPSGAKFQAYLIRDVSGTVLGIAFEQIVG